MKPKQLIELCQFTHTRRGQFSPEIELMAFENIQANVSHLQAVNSLTLMHIINTSLVFEFIFVVEKTERLCQLVSARG